MSDDQNNRKTDRSAARIGKVILEVKGLRTHLFTKRGVVKAVDGVDFYLREGETLGIVGESGSGKSMTALSVLRMEPKPAGRIVSGEIWLDGENLLEKSEEEMRAIRGRRISLILQDPQTALNPVFTIGDQVREAIRIHNRADNRKSLARMAIEMIRKVRPGIAIPIHYDDYDVFKSSLEDFKKAVREVGFEDHVRYLERGERLELPAPVRASGDDH